METMMLSLCMIMPATLQMNKSQAKNVCKYEHIIVAEAKKNKIEPEDVRKFVSPIIKDKLEAEAMSLNLLPKTNALDESFFE